MGAEAHLRADNKCRSDCRTLSQSLNLSHSQIVILIKAPGKRGFFGFGMPLAVPRATAIGVSIITMHQGIG